MTLDTQPLAVTIRTTIGDYLAGRIALDQFEDAMIHWSGDAFVWAPPDLLALLTGIEDALWRFRAKRLSGAQLRQRLIDIVEDHHVVS